MTQVNLKPSHFNLSGGQAVSQSLEVIGGQWRLLEVIGGHWRSLEVDSDQFKAYLDDERGFVDGMDGIGMVIKGNRS